MTLNRFFLICLSLVGVAWIALFIIDLNGHAHGGALYGHSTLRLELFLGGSGLVWTWTIVTMARTELFWKRRNATARPADSTAGAAIADLRRNGGTLTARSAAGRRFFAVPPWEVEVSAAAETVVFRGFTFLTAFLGNRPTAEITLRFQDILGGRVWVHHGRYALELRTTAGRVRITDAVQPFHSLATVLLDAAEWNRSDPDRFAAALAREPKLRTPWYGWVIAVAALAGVAGLAVFLWNLPAK